MSLRLSCFSLCLLNILWIGGTVSATASPLFPPGVVELTRSPGPVFPLKVDLDAIAQQACNILENPAGTLSKCHIRPDLLWESDLKSGDTGASAGALKFVSTETLVTSCGTWDAKLTLAPSLSPKDPKHGILEIRARLDLTHQATGRTVDYPLTLGLGLTGPWSLASPGERRGTSPRQSHRPAFAEKSDEEECLPAWFIEKYPDLALELQEEGCQACPED